MANTTTFDNTAHNIYKVKINRWRKEMTLEQNWNIKLNVKLVSFGFQVHSGTRTAILAHLVVSHPTPLSVCFIFKIITSIYSCNHTLRRSFLITRGTINLTRRKQTRYKFIWYYCRKI